MSLNFSVLTHVPAEALVQHRTSKYDQIVDAARKGKIVQVPTDAKRAANIAIALRLRLQREGLTNLRVKKNGTAVYIFPKDKLPKKK